MALPAIPPVSVESVESVAGVGVSVPFTPSLPTTPSGSVAGGDTSFGEMLTSALDSVSASHARADDLALRAATGDLDAVHDYTIAATEAQLLTQLTVEIRNRAIDAFNDIMRMQV